MPHGLRARGTTVSRPETSEPGIHLVESVRLTMVVFATDG